MLPLTGADGRSSCGRDAARQARGDSGAGRRDVRPRMKTSADDDGAECCAFGRPCVTRLSELLSSAAAAAAAPLLCLIVQQLLCSAGWLAAQAQAQAREAAARSTTRFLAREQLTFAASPTERPSERANDWLDGCALDARSNNKRWPSQQRQQH